MGTTEELERYCPGGYHPVVIGDMLDAEPGLAPPQRRYRVLHKLGFGSYATVWLGRDTRTSTFVALKITTAEPGDGQSQEAQMLSMLAFRRVVTLHDQFTIDGLNGTHHVLVMDVVVPILSLLESSSGPSWRKSVARDIVLAVAQMHRAGIKHGDLHLGNLGCAFPELNHQSEDHGLQDLSPYEITIVLPSDPSKQTSSLPPYVVAPYDLGKDARRLRSEEALPEVKIIDFGSARGLEEPAAGGGVRCAIEACAPEVAFTRIALNNMDPQWGPAADVRAVGAMLYEIVSGSPLISRCGFGDGLLRRMAVLAGALPVDWQAYWQSSPCLRNICEPSLYLNTVEKWKTRHQMLRPGCVDDMEANALVGLLQKILVLDPEKRPSLEDVLKDPWFAKS
ncbi:kinase-like protein [Trametes polyzona]|nr:kinase-like protein [Trametes polyzona]